ncbi:HNH endonuclease [Agrobacterium vitis]|uniref:HNH endonuclease n=1 Tax=Agrobacterium vitis TaxID=373 RepID=UPI001573A141|nr:HNH endonuclease [Agrobacterium vitis]NSZ52941.1 HNH endonuclease [Agrobacterium vitis]NTA31700.1 HNH endonuclease [Agrobacterium vitis]
MTDIGTTKRRPMTPARRLRIWEAHGGKCCLCGQQIDGAREPWIIEHLTCLGLGGADEDKNCGPAHEACRRDKDKLDVQAIAKAKRVKQRHLGIKAAKPPIRGASFPKTEKAANRRQKPLPPRRGLYQEDAQ